MNGKRALGTASLLAIAVIGGAACSSPSGSAATRNTVSNQTPDWLSRVLANIKAQPVTNPPTRIATGRYRGATVYYRSAHCCDVQGVVFDEHGAQVCAADGGFTGTGDGRCPDFWSTLSDCKMFWQDARGKTPVENLCLQVPNPDLPLQ